MQNKVLQRTFSKVSNSLPGRDWAQRQFDKYDKNKDGKLMADEWSAMIIKPKAADVDKDGAVTLDEYIEFRLGK